MPITSFTGLPGNGKTALMVEHLMNSAKEAKRPLFAAGIDGLQPGLATILPDPRDWNAVRPGERCSCHDTEDSGPCDAHVVPNGSLIYVDESWKWFGHLHDATRQQTPRHVLQLAEHRHRGIDFVWTFQQPNQIYPFARGLMAEHHHVVRRFGTRMIDVFTWAELNEDVKSQAKREAALRKTRTLPSHVFDSYKSAEVHTIKARIPFKVMVLPLLLVAAVVLGYYAINALRPDAFAGNLTGKKPAAIEGETVAVGGGQGSGGERKEPLYANATEYAVAHLPRFGMMPWTAPVYDDRGITADPALYCLSSMGGENALGERVEPSCTCLTEQGTLYQVSQPECRTIARRGPVYNPYKERKETREEPPQWAVASAPAVASAGVVIPGDVKAVGTGGEEPAPGTAP